MAKYQGKTVKLNTPRALRKGETGYGKKRKVVFVKNPSTGKVKKITLFLYYSFTALTQALYRAGQIFTRKVIRWQMLL